MCVKNLLGVTSISEVWARFGGFILLKKTEKKLLVGDRRVTKKENKKSEKKLCINLNQAFLWVCTKNFSRVTKIREDMAVVRSPISHWDFFGFRHFEDVARTHWINYVNYSNYSCYESKHGFLERKESYSGPNSAEFRRHYRQFRRGNFCSYFKRRLNYCWQKELSR